MKRELKKKTDSLRDLTANNLISSLDKQVEELNKNNLEIDTIIGLLRSKGLSEQQEESVKKALNNALELSSTIYNSMEENT